MTRINTNVSSLNAQQTLATSNTQLQNVLTQLSTGLQINSGADNPAGLIASESLNGDIIDTKQAVANSQTASQMISTADSALGQVSSLLDTIRGLVNEAASGGTMSPAQITANQSQIDSALNAINTIAKTTTFGGQNLLDGTLGFTTQPGTNYSTSTVSGLSVNQANFGSSNTLGVNVNVSQAATQAMLQTNLTAPAGNKATGTITLHDGGTINITAPTVGTQYNNTQLNIVQDANTAVGTPTASYDANSNVLTVLVNNASSTTDAAIASAIKTTGFNAVATVGTDVYNPALDTSTSQTPQGTITLADGTQIAVSAKANDPNHTGANSNFKINFTTGVVGAAGASAAWDGTDANGKGTGNLTVTIDSTSGATDAQIMAALTGAGAGQANLNATLVTAGPTGFSLTNDSGAGANATKAQAIGANGGSVTFTATQAGAAGNNIQFAVTDTGTTNAPTVKNIGGVITINVNSAGTTTMQEIADAVNEAGLGVTATTATGADTTGVATVGTTNLAGGKNADNITLSQVNSTMGGGSGTAPTGVTFQLSGSLGSQTFTFTNTETGAQMAAAVNALTYATGVTAAYDSGTNNLAFTSQDYGSNATVGINVATGGFLNTVENNQNVAANNSAGTDAEGTINGVVATGSGNTLSVDNANLSMNMTLTSNTTGNIGFTITGGGATFQIGPTVGANQQARIGLNSVNTTSLGGADGTLNDLASNGTAALATNPTTAAAIINEASSQVTSLRATLGAFQSSTLNSNITSLDNAVSNLTSAQNSIEDTDFAAASAALTRDQVLVQSGTAVLSIANHLPDNVLSLLKQ